MPPAKKSAAPKAAATTTPEVDAARHRAVITVGAANKLAYTTQPVGGVAEGVAFAAHVGRHLASIGVVWPI